MDAELKVSHQIENLIPRIDQQLHEVHSCQILPRSDVKRRVLGFYATVFCFLSCHVTFYPSCFFCVRGNILCILRICPFIWSINSVPYELTSLHH